MVNESHFSISHLLWMGGGAIGMQTIKAVWGYITKALSIGFKEGFVEGMKHEGKPLTPEEKADLDKRVKEKLMHAIAEE